VKIEEKHKLGGRKGETVIRYKTEKKKSRWVGFGMGWTAVRGREGWWARLLQVD
jgi:hypothetical protein